MDNNPGGRRRTNIRSPRNAAQAAYCRDAMSKSIYQVNYKFFLIKFFLFESLFEYTLYLFISFSQYS